MKQDLYKSRYVIAAMLLSMIGFYATINPYFKYTFLVLNVLSAIILVNRIRKS